MVPSHTFKSQSPLYSATLKSGLLRRNQSLPIYTPGINTLTDIYHHAMTQTKTQDLLATSTLSISYQ